MSEERRKRNTDGDDVGKTYLTPASELKLLEDAKSGSG